MLHGPPYWRGNEHHLSIPVTRDPVSIGVAVTNAIIASSVASGVAVVGGALTTAVFIGQAIGFAAVGALAVGASYAASKLLAPGGGMSQKNPINAPAVRGTIKQASAAQRIVFGRQRIGGVVYFYEVVPPKLYLGLIYSSMPIREFGNVTIEENLVPLIFNESGIGIPIQAPYFVNGTPKFRVAFQNGEIDQPVNPIIAQIFPERGADFRLPGLPNAVWEFDYGVDFEEFQSLWGQVQIPNPLVETREAAPIYDPRRTLNRWPDDWRDADDVADAISTWRATRNSSLIQAFWRAAPFGLNAGHSGTDWDRVAHSADFDDQPIALKDGGFIRRGTIDGVVTLDERPNAILESMLSANRGFEVRKAGRGWCEASMPKLPVFTITDSVIVGGIQFRRDRAKRDRVTMANALFVSPERKFTEVESPIYKREDLIEDDGEALERKLRLPFTTQHQNVQRIVKESVDESLLERSLTVAVSMRAFGIKQGDAVRVESIKYPHINGIYQVEEWALADNRASLSMSLSEYDRTIPISWNPENDEQEFSDLQEAA